MTEERTNIYDEITIKIIGQIEAGILPWVQPWQGGAGLTLHKNAHSGNAYSGINILLLWDRLYKKGFTQNIWLTFNQALALGGAVRKGEKGTLGVYADSFVPQKERETKTSQEDSLPNELSPVTEKDIAVHERQRNTCCSHERCKIGSAPPAVGLLQNTT